MIIDEITLINFGIYRDHHTINLSPKANNKPIILIGGENGHGKTTLLDAFQLVLFGKHARCSNRGNLSYQKYLGRCVNKDVNPNEGTSLELKFRSFRQGEERHYEIRRSWGQNGKGIREYFSVYVDDAFDEVLSKNWEEHLEELFPINISHLFLFDGEKIEEFAEVENAAQLLKTAIDSLLGLGVVDQLTADLSVLEKRKFKLIKTDKERIIIDDLEAQIDDVNENLAMLIAEKSSIEDELSQHEKDLLAVEALYRKEGGALYEDREAIEANMKSSQQKLSEVEEVQRAIAAGPAPLLLIKDLLQSMEEQDNLEEKAKKEKLLAEILSIRDEKTINQLEMVGVEQSVMFSIEDYLKEDRDKRHEKAQIHLYLNLDKESKEKLGSLLRTEMVSAKTELSTSLKSSEAIRECLLSLERTLAGVPEEEAISGLIEERRQLKTKIEQTQIRMASANLEIEKQNRELEQKESELKRVLESNASKDWDTKDSMRVVKHSRRVGQTLEKFREKVIEKHIRNIEKLILDSFNNLLRKKTLIERIAIDTSDFSVTLFGPKGQIISYERLSAGERQLLATAMLWGISRAAKMPLPTIIDTPLGRLDSSHRTNLVSNYFPMASHQVLLLSTDEEIVGKYYNQIKSRVSREYLLEYDQNREATRVVEGYYKQKDIS